MRGADQDCPGEGKCHGCAGWCDRCGDVDEVCDASGCMRHRCQRCDCVLTEDHKEFGESWGYTQHCFECLVAMTMKAALDFGLDEIKAGEKRQREIDAFVGWRNRFGIGRSRSRNPA